MDKEVKPETLGKGGYFSAAKVICAVYLKIGPETFRVTGYILFTVPDKIAFCGSEHCALL